MSSGFVFSFVALAVVFVSVVFAAVVVVFEAVVVGQVSPDLGVPEQARRCASLRPDRARRQQAAQQIAADPIAQCR